MKRVKHMASAQKAMKHFTRIITFLFAGFPTVALAATTCGSGLCNPLGYESLTTFLANILKIVSQIGFPVIVLFIVYIGFLFISAQGNPEKLSKARSYFFWAVVGALIVLGASALSLAIQATVDQLQQGQ